MDEVLRTWLERNLEGIVDLTENRVNEHLYTSVERIL